MAFLQGITAMQITSNTPILQANDIDINYQKKNVIQSLSIQIPPQQTTVLVGPNGSGKSTLLKALTRVMSPSRGHVLLDGKSILSVPSKQLAKQLSFLPQGPISPEGITVKDLVSYGRYPHQSLLGHLSNDDLNIINNAIEMTGLSDLATRHVDELSGGQRQKAWIAMTIAQQSNMMFLDEPTTYLDIVHQIDVLNLLQKLNRQHQHTIVMVLHDLNLAARYADHIIAMKDGQIIAQGDSHHIVSSDILKKVFGIEAHIFTDPDTNKPWFMPKQSL